MIETMKKQKLILNKEQSHHKLQRMALEIAEQLSEDNAELYLIGVAKKGVVISEILYPYLQPYFQQKIKLLSVELHKDLPTKITLSKNVNFNDCNIILVDDVANSGKTLTYALKPLLEFHPKRIQTLVLVERTYKKFPIKPDYIGLSISTTIQEHILVEIENNEVIGAYLI